VNRSISIRAVAASSSPPSAPSLTSVSRSSVTRPVEAGGDAPFPSTATVARRSSATVRACGALPASGA
jgi:hypothetical protein